ncbi:MAG: tetratricopeptide repeat protein [Deltaproteobacteria bacterium]|nr:tetratricopeptide repeat protein [Myxococcales bacterium]MDP3219545.1 tetratricopeptide repeat protein [Deltaproteobacteria bacterium]
MDDQPIERWVAAGREALAADHPGGALDPLRRALTQDPGHAVAHQLLALALLRLHRPWAALVEANAAILGDPESGETHAVLGDIQIARRDLRAATRHYEAAREFSPRAPAPLRGLAAVAAFDDDDAPALDLLREALALAPDDVETLVDVARLHLTRNRLDEAARFAERALAVEPQHRAALCGKGFALLHRGDVAGAREHAARALRRDPTHLDAIRLLAAVKARESLALGLWFRANAAVSGLGPRAGALLVGAFVAQSLLRLGLQDLGHPVAGEAVRWLWLAACLYSYVGPGLFRRLIEREIDAVALRGDD